MGTEIVTRFNERHSVLRRWYQELLRLTLLVALVQRTKLGAVFTNNHEQFEQFEKLLTIQDMSQADIRSIIRS